MRTGKGLRNLFTIILLHCNPVDPHRLWEATRVHLCDDLHHHLTRRLNIDDPTEEQVYDYGLYEVDMALRKSGKSLHDFPDMPTPQLNWAARVGNQLLAEQLAYDHGELQQMVGQDYPNLNEGQK
jgi:hypothetical protein